MANGGFETNSFTGWTLSGNVAPLSYGPQTFIIGHPPISSNAQSGQYAAGFGSVGSDGTLSQNIQTTAGQSYTVQFWLAKRAAARRFHRKWNGQTLLALNNAPAQGYTEYTYMSSAPLAPRIWNSISGKTQPIGVWTSLGRG